MSFLDALLGHPKPVRPDLDVLFAIPAAARTLRTAFDMAPTGTGTVCLGQAPDRGTLRAGTEILESLHLDPGISVEVTTDADSGSTWITCRQQTPDIDALVAALHAINTMLSDKGFGPNLMYTITGFATAGRPDHRIGLVYLFKRGTVYPFAPTTARHRDDAFELQSLIAIADKVPVEPDLEHWFPIWHSPVP